MYIYIGIAVCMYVCMHVCMYECIYTLPAYLPAAYLLHTHFRYKLAHPYWQWPAISEDLIWASNSFHENRERDR